MPSDFYSRFNASRRGEEMALSGGKGDFRQVLGGNGCEGWRLDGKKVGFDGGKSGEENEVSRFGSRVFELENNEIGQDYFGYEKGEEDEVLSLCQIESES
ncbi:unnamed protein product [Dovyalis caffra]|uniref:Uncharacterized protein n=1 Tax=Dovyalis caffra TaxID=77055 RepID=A0AAV1SIK2_9ROSI|nr:unnamed protein product [Dovyalis caffra]